MLGTTACISARKHPAFIDSAHPELIKKGNLESIAILGTNDLHGNIENAGILASYIQKLKSEWGSRFLWFDAGSHLQGSFAVDQEKGAPMISLFNHLGLTAATLGGHEFDFGLNELSSRIEAAQFPYLSLNILDRKTQKQWEHDGVHKHFLISAGRIQVGVIGLTSHEAAPFAPVDVTQQLEFLEVEKSKNYVLKEAQELRNQGAQVVILIADLGIQCSEGQASPENHIRKPSEPLGTCLYQGPLIELLKGLPKGTLDAVLSGYSHTLIHHWVGGIPIIQSGSFGQYLHAIYLFYDTQKGRVISDKTLIEGPIPVQDGYRFHGKIMEKNPEIEAIFEPLVKKAQETRNTIIGHTPMHITQPSKLVADALLDIAQTDFALIAPGLIQKNIPSGAISLGQIYDSIPYMNSYAKLHLSGDELKSIIRTAKTSKPKAKSRPTLSGNKLIYGNKQYTLALPDFMAKNLPKISPDRIEWRPDFPIRDALVQYIKNHPHLLK